MTSGTVGIRVGRGVAERGEARADAGADTRRDAGETYLSLIVPVWNGAAKLRETLHDVDAYLRRQPYVSEVVVVDDYSGPATVRVLRWWARGRADVTVLRNDRNLGKGRAVARGMLAARGRYRVFTDADLPYPLEAISSIVAALEAGSDVAIASRRLVRAPRPSPALSLAGRARLVMSRIFNLLVRGVLLPGVRDTQAGLKGFTAAAADLIFRQLTVDRFAFDVEALYIATRHGMRVAESPVCARDDHAGRDADGDRSTVRVARDAPRMAADVILVRWNAWCGRYR